MPRQACSARLLAAWARYPRARWIILGALLASPLTFVAVSSSPNAETPTVAASPVAIARGRVDVEGGIIQLAASRDGIVREVFVEEGDAVKQGETLAALDDRQARLDLDLARRQIAQVVAILEGLTVRLRAAEREEARLRSLAENASVARIELDQAQDQVALLRSEVKAARAAIEVAQARIRIAEYEVERHLVRAPRDGHIVRRQVRPGDGVSTLNVTPLFWFAPDTPRIVRAEIDERFINSVEPGMPAELVIEGDRPLVLGARVVRMGLLFGPKRPVTDDPYERADARVVEVIVAPDAKTALVLGQRVLVRFKQLE
jgi:HlyD family secretion protein